MSTCPPHDYVPMGNGAVICNKCMVIVPPATPATWNQPLPVLYYPKYFPSFPSPPHPHSYVQQPFRNDAPAPETNHMADALKKVFKSPTPVRSSPTWSQNYPSSSDWEGRRSITKERVEKRFQRKYKNIAKRRIERMGLSFDSFAHWRDFVSSAFCARKYPTKTML